MNLRWKIAQAAEIRWWKWYLSRKEKEDYLAWKTNYWKSFWHQLPEQPIAGARVLDAGCGPAGINIILSDFAVTAIDPLLQQYQAKIEHFQPEKYPFVDYQQQGLEDLSCSQCFDWIFCLNVINHVADLPLAIANLWASLVPGGRLVLSVDAHNFYWFKQLLRVLPTDILHPHQYDLAEYQQMLVKQGGKIKASYEYKKEFFFSYHILLIEKPTYGTTTN